MHIQKRLSIVILMYFLNFSAAPLLGQYASGTGTADDPFLIETAEQLNSIGLHVEHLNKHFKLIADIDISAYPNNQFNTIGTETATINGRFTGVFDGNGHTINNLTYI